MLSLPMTNIAVNPDRELAECEYLLRLTQDFAIPFPQLHLGQEIIIAYQALLKHITNTRSSIKLEQIFLALEQQDSSVADNKSVATKLLADIEVDGNSLKRIAPVISSLKATLLASANCQRSLILFFLNNIIQNDPKQHDFTLSKALAIPLLMKSGIKQLPALLQLAREKNFKCVAAVFEQYELSEYSPHPSQEAKEGITQPRHRSTIDLNSPKAQCHVLIINCLEIIKLLQHRRGLPDSKDINHNNPLSLKIYSILIEAIHSFASPISVENLEHLLREKNTHEDLLQLENLSNALTQLQAYLVEIPGFEQALMSYLRTHRLSDEMLSTSPVLDLLKYVKPNMVVEYMYHHISSSATKTLSALIHQGINHRFPGNKNGTFLQSITREGRTSLLSVMLSECKDLTFAEKQDAFFIAVAYGRVDAIKMLLQQGVDVNKADANGHTPLFHAVRQVKIELIQLFLKYGAKDKNALELAKTYAEHPQIPWQQQREFQHIVLLLQQVENAGLAVAARKLMSELPLPLTVAELPRSKTMADPLSNLSPNTGEGIIQVDAGKSDIKASTPQEELQSAWQDCLYLLRLHKKLPQLKDMEAIGLPRIESVAEEAAVYQMMLDEIEGQEAKSKDTVSLQIVKTIRRWLLRTNSDLLKDYLEIRLGSFLPKTLTSYHYLELEYFLHRPMTQQRRDEVDTVLAQDPAIRLLCESDRSQSRTLFRMAAQLGFPVCIQSFIIHGRNGWTLCDLKLQDEEESPLNLAWNWGHIAVVKTMLMTDTAIPEIVGLGKLYEAKEKNDITCFNELLAVSPDTETHNIALGVADSPAFLAALLKQRRLTLQEKFEVFQKLCFDDEKARSLKEALRSLELLNLTAEELNRHTQNGSSYLTYACNVDDFDFVISLAALGANPTLIDSNNNCTAREIAIFKSLYHPDATFRARFRNLVDFLTEYENLWRSDPQAAQAMAKKVKVERHAELTSVHEDRQQRVKDHRQLDELQQQVKNSWDDCLYLLQTISKPPSWLQNMAEAKLPPSTEIPSELTTLYETLLQESKDLEPKYFTESHIPDDEKLAMWSKILKKLTDSIKGDNPADEKGASVLEMQQLAVFLPKLRSLCHYLVNSSQTCLLGSYIDHPDDPMAHSQRVQHNQDATQLVPYSPSPQVIQQQCLTDIKLSESRWPTIVFQYAPKHAEELLSQGIKHNYYCLTRDLVKLGARVATIAADNEFKVSDPNLHLAIISDKDRVVSAILQVQSQITAKQLFEAFNLAISKGCLNAALAICEETAFNVNSRDATGHTSLMRQARLGNFKGVRLLMAVFAVDPTLSHEATHLTAKQMVLQPHPAMTKLFTHYEAAWPHGIKAAKAAAAQPFSQPIPAASSQALTSMGSNSSDSDVVPQPPSSFTVLTPSYFL